MTEQNLPVIPQAVVTARRANFRRRRICMPVRRGTLLIPKINLYGAAVFSLNWKLRSSHFNPLNLVSRYAPNSQAGSGLNCCFQPAQRRFLAGTAWYKQNVFAVQGEVGLFPVERILHIHLELFPLIGVRLQP